MLIKSLISNLFSMATPKIALSVSVCLTAQVTFTVNQSTEISDEIFNSLDQISQIEEQNLIEKDYEQSFRIDNSGEIYIADEKLNSQEMAQTIIEPQIENNVSVVEVFAPVASKPYIADHDQSPIKAIPSYKPFIERNSPKIKVSSKKQKRNNSSNEKVNRKPANNNNIVIAAVVIQSESDEEVVSTNSASEISSSNESSESSSVNEVEEVEEVQIILVASDDTLSVEENSSVSVDISSLKANDTDDNTGTIFSFSNPTNGTLTSNGTALTYTPTTSFFGADSFTYTLTNGDTTASATVTITISEDIVVMVATNDSMEVDENSSVAIAYSALLNNDTEPGLNTSISYTNPTKGTLTLLNEVLTYTPNAGYFGSDSFEYTITNDGYSDTATVSITINEDVVEMIANDDSFDVDENSSVAIAYSALLDNDTEPGQDTSVSYTNPTKGTLSLINEVLTYTPTAGYFGSDSFEYTITNDGYSDTATVSITINEDVVEMIANDDSFDVDENSSVAISYSSLLDNDTEPGLNTSISYTNPTNGTLSLQNEVLTYTPTVDYHGSDSFEYTITNDGYSDTATVSITISEDSDVPVIRESLSSIDNNTNSISLAHNPVAQDGHLYISAISFKDNSLNINSINGLNLTWEHVYTQCSNGSDHKLAIYYASGTPNSTDIIEVNLDGQTEEILINTIRVEFAKIDDINLLENFNTIGKGETVPCPESDDDSSDDDSSDDDSSDDDSSDDDSSDDDSSDDDSSDDDSSDDDSSDDDSSDDDSSDDDNSEDDTEDEHAHEKVTTTTDNSITLGFVSASKANNVLDLKSGQEEVETINNNDLNLFSFTRGESDNDESGGDLDQDAIFSGVVIEIKPHD